MNRLTSLLASLALTLTLTFALTVTQPAPALADTGAAKYSKTAQKATNAARVKHDRTRLKANTCLRKYARSHARAMAEAQSIWHQDMGAVLKACKLTMVGENVAAGFSTGRAVVNQGWMKSPGHRENILNRKYRAVVVAAVEGADGRWYAAQLFGRR